ncbi:ABC transporter substrate-binding protein [Microbacterium terrisoli]|uniref:ABC transporter substrate-binding protein n=1 Tax=Microbacterium terrisoli TaxID=3242192 RepID=UPI002803A7CF|nr:ABC transporter substrate-binding protein [Microbacterium protaetiae]
MSSLTTRLTTAAALLAASLLAVTACSSGSPGGGDHQTPGEPVAVTVASLPTANLASVQLGAQQGFFTDEGLDVTIQNVQSGSAMITGLLGGSFDFIASGYVPAFTAQSQGLPLKFIAGNDTGADTPDKDWQIVVAGKGSSVKTPQDLATATVAVNALKGVAEVQVRASLEKQGIDDSKMKLTEIPFPEMPVALAQGRVGAALVPEPFVTAVLQAGGHVVDTPYVVMGKHFPNGAWETSQQMIDQHPDTVAAFTRAITKAVEYARDHPDAVRAIIPKYTSVTPEMANAIRLPVFSPDLNVDLMQELIGYTKKYGTLEKDLNAADLIYKPKS